MSDIRKYLQTIGGWGSVYVPEYTYSHMRIDAAVIDIRSRWIRGFEIKMTRADFLADEKWLNYAEFCSSLSIVCPKGLIQREEIQKPLGLLWVSVCEKGTPYERPIGEWIRRPKRFQSREGLAWLFTYVRVIEKELPRMDIEITQLKQRLEWELKT